MEEEQAQLDRNRPGGGGYGIREIAVAAILAIAAYFALALPPSQQLGDSEFTVLVSEQLLNEGTLELDQFFPPHQPRRFYPGMRAELQWPRQVQPGGVRRAERQGVTEGPLYYIYPQGTPILVAPLVAMARAFGTSAIGSDGAHDPEGEHRSQRFLGSLLMALAVGCLFLTARTVLPMGPSLLAATAACLGTQIMSTAARSLQAHTLMILLGTLIALHLVRAERERGQLRPILLGTLLSFAFFVRPTAVFTILPTTIWVAARHRHRLLPLVATGAVWLALFLAHSRATFGTWLPDYYTRGSGFELGSYFTGLYAQTFSPSRGLFVFVPLAAVCVILAIVRWRRLRNTSLSIWCLGCVTLHILVMASFRNWWGGFCYGARFSSDLVPFFFLLGVLAWEARAPERSPVVPTVFFSLALAVGALFNGAGAWTDGGMRWNLFPVPIGSQPERCLDWSNPQWWVALRPDLIPLPDGAGPVR